MQLKMHKNNLLMVSMVAYSSYSDLFTLFTQPFGGSVDKNFSPQIIFIN